MMFVPWNTVGYARVLLKSVLHQPLYALFSCRRYFRGSGTVSTRTPSWSKLLSYLVSSLSRKYDMTGDPLLVT